MERIDKVLASQNVGSRKEVHNLIKRGLININGITCINKAQKVNPESDEVTVANQKIEFKRYVYIMMNKPSGILSASNDKKAQTVIDIIPKPLFRKGLFPAGRLDKDTEGLLIITNDGDFAHRMLSPKKKVYKHYLAELDAQITQDTINAFKKGILFYDGTQCLPADLSVFDKDGRVGLVKICEGKFHQIKKMFISQGLNVTYLKRVKIGQLKLDEKLEKGQCRFLTEQERDSVFS